MAGQQKLLSLWVLLLLMAALCPGVHYAHSKRRGTSKGGGKSDGNQAAPAQARGLPKPGLKWAGAAAGILGGTGLGFLGRHKHGSGSHFSQRAEQDQRLYHNERQRFYNQTAWRAIVNATGPVFTSNVFLTLAHMVSVLIAVWIRDI